MISQKKNIIKINNILLTPVRKDLYDNILLNLYKRINLYKHRYQIIQERTHLQEISNIKHYVSYHYQGYNYLLFFTIINGKPNSYVISKKELKYYYEQNNLDEIKIYSFNMNNLPIRYYQDTIFDGKILRLDNYEVNGIFMIYDCYTLCGNNFTELMINKKIEIVNTILNEINNNITDNNFSLTTIKLYEDNEIPNMLFDKFKENKHKINGLVFLPEISNKYYIYVNEDEFNRLRNEEDINEISEEKPNINQSQNEFIMKKTDLPDVYELFIETPKGLIREGIAHIPNIHTSHHCQKLFEDKDIHKMICIKSVKFNKWIPLCQDITELSNVIF